MILEKVDLEAQLVGQIVPDYILKFQKLCKLTQDLICVLKLAIKQLFLCLESAIDQDVKQPTQRAELTIVELNIRVQFLVEFSLHNGFEHRWQITLHVEPFF